MFNRTKKFFGINKSGWKFGDYEKPKEDLKVFKETEKESTVAKTEESKTPPLMTIETSYQKSIASVLGLSNQNPDKILKEKGLDIYDEMERKDTHLYSVYTTRKLAVSLIPWEIKPADDSDQSKEIAEFVFTVIDDCKGIFSEDIKQLLDAIGKGFSILEIVWKMIEKGRWNGKYGIEDLVFHKQKFWFFKDAKWRKSKTSVAVFKDVEIYEGEEVPWEKIIHYAYDSQDSLYGRGAFEPIYWFYWFKKEGWKSWIIFLNKYGTPTVVGKYPDGAKQADQNNLLSVIETIQEETGLIIPQSMQIDFLTTGHTGPSSFHTLSDACNAEISKAILGATQTVEEGKRGSYALSRAHSEVRKERVEADSIQISDVIQQQLVKRVVDFNFIIDKYPQFIMKWGKEELPEGNGAGPKEEEITDDDSTTPGGEELTLEAPEISLPEMPSLQASELQNAFRKVYVSVIKNTKNKSVPVVVNVGPIKKCLSEVYGETTAFSIARGVKKKIESFRTGFSPRVFSEIFKETCKEINVSG